jgi:hypothetical protein
MALTPESSSAGQPIEVTHETLQTAARDSLPEQKNALGSTRDTVTARTVPSSAFSELGAEASAGHNRNIGQIVKQMTEADQRYAGVIQGVGNTTGQFRDLDEAQAGKQREQNVQLAQVQRRQPVSQNGWPVNPGHGYRTVPGSSVRLDVANGPAGDVLIHTAGQLHSRVESFDLDSTKGENDDWGYANRSVRNSTDVSNHASATAFDLNATRHPLGASGTFTQTQVNEIHTILGEVDNVVRWGGDYSGRPDEMHFEIVGTQEQVARVAERLRHLNASP